MKQGFIPIIVIITVVITAAITSGITVVVKNKQSKKTAQEMEARIQSLESKLESQTPQEEFLTEPEEEPTATETPSTQTPSTSNVSTSSSPSSQPAQASNMKTWSGKMQSYVDEKQYPISFQYPDNLTIDDNSDGLKSNGQGQLKLSNEITMAMETSPSNSKADLTSQFVQSRLRDWDRFNKPPFSRTDANGVKMTTIGGKQAATWKSGPVNSASDDTTTTPNRVNAYIKLGDTGLLVIGGPLSTESVYRQILSSMKFED